MTEFWRQNFNIFYFYYLSSDANFRAKNFNFGSKNMNFAEVCIKEDFFDVNNL